MQSVYSIWVVNPVFLTFISIADANFKPTDCRIFGRSCERLALRPDVRGYSCSHREACRYGDPIKA